MAKQRSSPPAGESLRALFLRSHGLRTPVTAIRWACGRLRRGAGGPLTQEQRHLVDQMYDNARRLTIALESMLLLSQFEEGTRPDPPQDICLPSLLELVRERSAGTADVALRIHGPHIHLRTGRAVLQAIISDLFVVFLEVAPGDRAAAVVDIDATSQETQIIFRASFLLPLLRAPSESGMGGGDTRDVVGGTPGLMFSMAQELTRALQGSLTVEEIITGEFVADGTVELREHAADEYRIVLRIPVAGVINDACNGSPG